MLITSRGYMQTRSLEAGMALAMFVTGLMLVTPGYIDPSAKAFDIVRTWSPLDEWSGGVLLMIIAVMRWAALAVNSHWRATPVFRLIGCCIGCGFWLTATIGLWQAPIAAVPWVAGLAACIAAKEAYSGFRTGLDADTLDTFGFQIRAFNKKRRAEETAGA